MDITLDIATHHPDDIRRILIAVGKELSVCLSPVSYTHLSYGSDGAEKPWYVALNDPGFNQQIIVAPGSQQTVISFAILTGNNALVRHTLKVWQRDVYKRQVQAAMPGCRPYAVR